MVDKVLINNIEKYELSFFKLAMQLRAINYLEDKKALNENEYWDEPYRDDDDDDFYMTDEKEDCTFNGTCHALWNIDELRP